MRHRLRRRPWRFFGIVLLLVLLSAARHEAAAQDLQAAERIVIVGGVSRTYLLHVPTDLSRPAPLVLVFHGGGGRPEGIMRTTGFNDIADRQRFVVAYPAGSGRLLGNGGTWNIGGASSPSNADDVAFIRALLRQLVPSVPIDPSRVYATGESMGGVFAYRLACEMSDSLAAIAAVAATMVEPNCAPQSPVALLHIHGTADENIPLDGGQGAMTARMRSWPPPSRGLQLWSGFDGCGGPPTVQADGPETSCQTGRSCRAPVEVCTVRGGGHAWPGSEPQRWQQRFGVYVSQSFPASQRIWAFFAANPKVQ